MRYRKKRLGAAAGTKEDQASEDPTKDGWRKAELDATSPADQGGVVGVGGKSELEAGEKEVKYILPINAEPVELDGNTRSELLGVARSELAVSDQKTS